MKTVIRSGKGGWVVQFEGEGEFHIFRGDEYTRLVKTFCKKALNVDLDTILAERQTEIDTKRAELNAMTEAKL